MPWFTEGIQTNPSAGTLLADGGASSGVTSFVCTVIVSATVLTTVVVQHRNAANSASLMEQSCMITANDTQNLNFGTHNLANGERMRVVTSGVIVGSVQASIVGG